MRTILNFIFAAALLAAASCGGSRPGGAARSPDATPQPQAAAAAESRTPGDAPDGVERVSADELRAALEGGEAVALDVRGGVAFSLGHIRGALSAPAGLIGERAAALPRDKLVVTYCA